MPLRRIGRVDEIRGAINILLERQEKFDVSESKRKSYQQRECENDHRAFPTHARAHKNLFIDLDLDTNTPQF
jgi:hypothetical protein